MKITSVTGVKSIENVKCFKPVSKLFLKCKYTGTRSAPKGFTVPFTDPQIRVRLVDGANGSSKEIVPEMSVSILSEIAAKYEGYQRRAFVDYSGATEEQPTVEVTGYDIYSIIIGQQLDVETISAVDLSNDKYLDIDLRNLDPFCEYELWGMESHIINPFVRSYQKFYLSAGEIEKSFSVGENEVLVYPLSQIKEIQLYAKHTSASPVFRREELILDEESRNDLTTVSLTEDNDLPLFRANAVLPIKFGYSEWGVMSIHEFTRFEIRRDDGLESLTFLMIDTVPSVTTI